MCVLILVDMWRESRGQELYGKANVDSAGFNASFPSSRALCGFFCNGEIGPVAGRNFLHAYTASIGLIY